MAKLERTCVNCTHENVQPTEYPCGECTHNAQDHFMPKTNADKIQSMGLIELAKWITDNDIDFNDVKDCLEWLQAEYEGEPNVYTLNRE